MITIYTLYHNFRLVNKNFRNHYDLKLLKAKQNAML